MKLFDSHAHLDDEKFNEDREKLIEQIHNENVEKFVSAGYSLETSKKAIELSKKYKYIKLNTTATMPYTASIKSTVLSIGRIVS